MYQGEFLHSLLFICIVREMPKLLLKCPVFANIMGFLHQMNFSCVWTANRKINNFIWTLGQQILLVKPVAD